MRDSWIKALLRKSRRDWQSMRKQARLLQFAISIAAIAILSYVADLSNFIASLREVPGQAVVAATMLSVAATVLGAVRGWLVMRDFGLAIGFLPAARATLLGSVSGLFAQFVGQAMVRSAYLRSYGIPYSGTLLLTLYERIVAALVLTVIALVGAAHLFGAIYPEITSGGWALVRLIVALVAALLLGVLFGYGELAGVILRRLATINVAFRVARLSALTLGGQMLNLGVFLVIGVHVAPGVAVDKFVAATAVVMFAAALPISFAGWGIREFGAVYAYGVIGVGAEQALTISVLAGALSTIMLVALTAATSVARTPTVAIAAESGVVAPEMPFDFFAFLCWLLPLGAATLVFFQVYILTAKGATTVNLADPVAALGALAALVLWVRSRAAMRPRWRIQAVEPALLAMTAVIVVAFLNGWISIGWIPWSFFNRFVGWFVLMAYLLTGALVVNHAGDDGLAILSRTLVAAAAAIVLSEWGILLAAWANGIDMPNLPMVGQAQNPNAFGFQLVIALAVALIWMKGMGGRGGAAVQRWLAGLILSGIWMSSSRTLYVTAVLLLSATVVFRVASLRSVVQILIISIGLVQIGPALTAIAATLQAGGPGAVGALSSSNLISPNVAASLRSNFEPDRAMSTIGAWRLWLERPFLGSGLGAFVQREFTDGLPLQVIHNSALWLLAETGVIGLGVFAVSFVAVGRQVLAQWRESHGAADAMVLAALAIMVLAMQLHDMLYQRIFWLVVGAALAQSMRDRDSASS